MPYRARVGARSLLETRIPTERDTGPGTATGYAVRNPKSTIQNRTPPSRVHLSSTRSRGLASATPTFLVGAHSLLRQVARYTGMQPGSGDSNSLGGTFYIPSRNRVYVVSRPAGRFIPLRRGSGVGTHLGCHLLFVLSRRKWYNACVGLRRRRLAADQEPEARP